MSNLWNKLERSKELAKVNLDDGHEPFVVEVLAAYLEYHPNDSFAWFAYGDALRVIGRFKEAASALRRALQNAEPDKKPIIRIRLGTVYNARGHRVKAEKWFARAGDSEYSSDLDWYWILRGANLAEMGKLDEAEACHRRAIHLNERNGEAYLNLGLVLRAKRNYAEALTALQISNTLDPNVTGTVDAIESLANIDEALALVEDLVRDEA